MRNIALIGKARAGKDTAAAHLVHSFAYTRLAFADPLKEMALRVNPIIAGVMFGDMEVDEIRMAEVVSDHGWECAKDNYPEVRRLLQQIGQTQREIEEDYWLNILLRKVAGAEKLNMPVVVTDVRYRNEALALRERGFRLVRIIRPQPAEPFARYTRTTLHDSETELDGFVSDVDIVNGAGIDSLHAMIASQVS